MTITIPTGDLVGVLSDAAPFACTNTKLEDINVVRVSWDGDMLHAQATDLAHFGWSSWHPDDESGHEHQEELFTKWGGADPKWSATISLADVKDTISAFKLLDKQYYTPLTVDHRGDALKISRDKANGLPAITMLLPDQFVTMPPIQTILDEHPHAFAVETLKFSADRLAHFAKVRQRGEMRLRFTGFNSPVIVTIGDRFTGAIAPIREDVKEEGDEPAGGGSDG